MRKASYAESCVWSPEDEPLCDVALSLVVANARKCGVSFKVHPAFSE